MTSHAVTAAERVDGLIGLLHECDPAIWIDRVEDAELRRAAAALDAVAPERRGRLHGVTFAVKDNIDIAGRVTTVGLPGAAYRAAATAPAVADLLAAGALLVGKTNLDQLATGLVGTRSPYGTPRNPLAPDRVPGGSSSGSAVSVAAGLVDVALGTDTAGSGRVPAACVGVVGLKPAPGVVTTEGVFPASPSLDCLSIFARGVRDAALAYSVIAPTPWPVAAGSFTLGVPHRRWLRGLEPAAADAWATDTLRLAASGHAVVDVDMQPFFEAGDLLYGGAWLAERTAVIGHLVHDGVAGVDPIVRRVVERGRSWSGTDAFDAVRHLAALRRATASVWQDVDALVVPTVPFVPTLAEVAEDPIGVNEALGRFTTFANLVGLAALTVPTIARGDGLLASVTVLGPADRAAVLRAVGSAFAREHDVVCGAPPGWVDLAVVGAHLRGEPLNRALTDRGAVLVDVTTTAACYRLYHLRGGPPERPGLERVATGGQRIDVEVWRMSEAGFGAVVAEVPPPLAIGSVELRGDRWVKGFVCEPHALVGSRDISSFGGWRAYRAG